MATLSGSAVLRGPGQTLAEAGTSA